MQPEVEFDMMEGRKFHHKLLSSTKDQDHYEVPIAAG